MVRVNDGILGDINNFLEDMQNELAGVDDAIEDLISGIGGIGGNLTSALQFGNFELDILGCSSKPQESLSDCYQFASGSVGQFKSDIESIESVSDAVDNPPEGSGEVDKTGFLEPSPDQLFGTPAEELFHIQLMMLMMNLLKPKQEIDRGDKNLMRRG